jgi:hypothetical protein
MAGAPSGIRRLTFTHPNRLLDTGKLIYRREQGNDPGASSLGRP